MKKLYLTNAKRRTIYGREEVNIPSRFINEINEDLINVENVDEKKIVKKEKILESNYGKRYLPIIPFIFI